MKWEERESAAQATRRLFRNAISGNLDNTATTCSNNSAAKSAANRKLLTTELARQFLLKSSKEIFGTRHMRESLNADSLSKVEQKYQNAR
jgi:hypothetical protein